MALEFDKHPHIKYVDLDHLYWGDYPYRVSVDIPEKQRKQCRDANALRRARDGIFDQISFDTELVYRAKKTGLNFFFTDTHEASLFIDSNADMIHEVVRPTSLREIDILQDRRVRLRNTLYWGQYRWCITFTGDTWFTNCMTTQEVDRKVTEIFGERDVADYRYKPRTHSPRKLYLREDTDVILVKLSFEDENISSIEEVRLREQPQ